MPVFVSADFIRNKILQLFVKLRHEICAWSDAIWVKSGFFWEFNALVFCFEFEQLSLLGGPESPASLLIDLCPRRHAIDSQKEKFLWLNDPEENFNVMKNVFENGLFGDTEFHVRVIWMRAGVNYPVHVKVKIVEFRNLKITTFPFFHRSFNNKKDP